MLHNLESDSLLVAAFGEHSSLISSGRKAAERFMKTSNGQKSLVDGHPIVKFVIVRYLCWYAS